MNGKPKYKLFSMKTFLTAVCPGSLFYRIIKQRCAFNLICKNNDDLFYKAVIINVA